MGVATKLLGFITGGSKTAGGLVTAISVFFFGSHAVAKYQDKKDSKNGL